MEVESFEDEEIARVLNERFVPIKVDREERPDVDAVYMTAVQLLTGGGGWPMSVWLTPDREPFFGGHLLPAARRRARRARGFLGSSASSPTSGRATPERVQRRDRLARARRSATRARAARRAGARTCPARTSSRRRSAASARAFDEAHGGLRRAPKFPSSLPVRLLLRYHRRTRDAEALRMATRHAREDGGRRHPRPARRRLPPLLDRRGLARPALREDALRQRAPRGRLRRGVAGDAGAATSRASCARRSTTSCAR